SDQPFGILLESTQEFRVVVRREARSGWDDGERPRVDYTQGRATEPRLRERPAERFLRLDRPVDSYDDRAHRAPILPRRWLTPSVITLIMTAAFPQPVQPRFRLPVHVRPRSRRRAQGTALCLHIERQRVLGGLGEGEELGGRFGEHAWYRLARP